MLLHGVIVFGLSWHFGAWDAEEIRVEPPQGRQDSMSVSVRTEAARPEWTGEASTEFPDLAPEAPVEKKAVRDFGRLPAGHAGLTASRTPHALDVPKGVPESKLIEVHAPQPEYPRKARERKWEGTATIELTVGTDGTCSCRLTKSSGYDILDEAALKTAATWRYHPIDEPRKFEMDFTFKLSR